MMISTPAVIVIAIVTGLLAAVMLGIQMSMERRNGLIGPIIFTVVIAAALIGIWYDPTTISLSAYLVIMAIWMFMTRNQNPRVLPGIIMILPACVLIYAKRLSYGYTTAVIAAIVAYALAVIALIIALVCFNRNSGSRSHDNRNNRNYRPSGDNLYGRSRVSSDHD